MPQNLQGGFNISAIFVSLLLDGFAVTLK